MAEGKVPISDAIYAMFVPLNDNKYPVMELVRRAILSNFFDKESAPKTARFIKSRFPGDVEGVDSGPDIDVTEIGLVGFRVLDMINKTPLKCYFMDSVEWYTDYPVIASKRLRFLANVALSMKDKVELRSVKEMTKLGIPRQTIDSVFTYYLSNNAVDVVSGLCALMFLSCLANVGNRALDRG